ncbi:DNA repair protein RadA [Deltaproteobacteria bacterium PRO3]|nr:DNA repair protein RadA [Deltaproteobacteria bacterium PRO3]
MHQRRERRGFVGGEVGKNLAIQFDARFLQPTDELGVAEVILAAARIDAEDEKPAEIALLAAASDVSVAERLLDRLLGGGMVPGSVILLGGDPGIGKSTLVLQVLARLGEAGGKVAYLSGEESADQIKLRAERLGVKSQNLYVMTENDLSRALPQIEALKPQMLVVDSIQTVYQPDLGSAPGSVTQVRECAGKLLYLAKSRGFTVLLVGHVTKEGALAGPKILEHIVDTVLYFEGDRGQPYRILRTFKNRFGSVSELAVYEMRGSGLVEVTNPSELFLSDSPELAPGSVVVSSLKGTRPLLAELQALVTPSSLGMPRRVTVGVDSQRVALLCAVLEKIVGLHLGGQDIFLNVVGGLDVDEPAVDLGVLLAIVSSFQNRALQKRTLVLGEVGLSGEIRPVAGEAIRLQEAARLGFQRAILPKKGSRERSPDGLALVRVGRVQEALDFF